MPFYILYIRYMFKKWGGVLLFMKSKKFLKIIVKIVG